MIKSVEYYLTKQIFIKEEGLIYMGLIFRQLCKIGLMTGIWVFITKMYTVMPRMGFFGPPVIFAILVAIFVLCQFVSETGGFEENVHDAIMAAVVGIGAGVFAWFVIFIISFFTPYNDWEIFNFILILTAAVLEIRVIFV